MHENEVIARIHSLCAAYSWSLYRLAKESGITYSTLCSMIHKGNTPSISTLIKICSGFGITLADFFDMDGDHRPLSAAQRDHLQLWAQLSEANQANAEKYIRFLLTEQNEDP